jgi:probable O-glycosylation ligase (exosortase A-associated)
MALLLCFVLDYGRPDDLVPGLGALRLNTLIPWFVALGTLFSRRTPVPFSEFLTETNTKFLGVFLGLLVVSTMFATLTSNAFDVTRNVFMYVLIYMALVRQLNDFGRIQGVLKTLLLIHVVLMALNPDLFSGSGRGSVTNSVFLGDGNDFALSVNVCLPLCLFLMMEAPRKLARIFWALVVLLMVMAIVATQSRGGTIALVVVGIYFWAKSRRKALTAAMAVCAVSLVLYAAPEGYFERMRTSTDTEEGSAQARITAWKASQKMALENPLLGVGAGNFGSGFGRLEGGRWMTAHSIYFLLLGELGVPGLVWLVSLICFNLVANSRLQRDIRKHKSPQAMTMGNLLTSTSAALVGFAIAGAFLSAIYYPHIYVICGLLTATRHVVRRELAAGTEVKQLPKQSPNAALVPAQVRHGAISPGWQPRPLGVHNANR